MGGQKAKVYQLPQKQEQSQTNTYSPVSIANTPEAKGFLEAPLDFGDPVNVDPGVGRRTDLAEQEAENRWDSAFMSGLPSYVRQAYRAKDIRDVQSQGAYEAQQAEYANQEANNAMRTRKTLTELERRRQLLPQIFQTGGSGSSSGFTSTLSQPQPGFLQSFAGGLGQGLAGFI
jgi:hypothetical protein